MKNNKEKDNTINIPALLETVWQTPEIKELSYSNTEGTGTGGAADLNTGYQS